MSFTSEKVGLNKKQVIDDSIFIEDSVNIFTRYYDKLMIIVRKEIKKHFHPDFDVSSESIEWMKEVELIHRYLKGKNLHRNIKYTYIDENWEDISEKSDLEYYIRLFIWDKIESSEREEQLDNLKEDLINLRIYNSKLVRKFILKVQSQDKERDI